MKGGRGAHEITCRVYLLTEASPPPLPKRCRWTRVGKRSGERYKPRNQRSSEGKLVHQQVAQIGISLISLGQKDKLTLPSLVCKWAQNTKTVLPKLGRRVDHLVTILFRLF